MRNTIVICIIINICSLSLIAALYMFYTSIVSTQEDIRKDIAQLEAIVRQGIIFEVIDNEDKQKGAIDVANCCDMTLTNGGVSICVGK